MNRDVDPLHAAKSSVIEKAAAVIFEPAEILFGSNLRDHECRMG
jgi:hypothetical protein